MTAAIIVLFLSAASQAPLNANANVPAGVAEDSWGVFNSAIESGGPNRDDALALLGLIDDQRARDLLTAVFKGQDGTAIEYAASGLSPSQCRDYFEELQQAILNPAIQPKIRTISAIGRAGTSAAAELMGSIADTQGQPAAGIAFGVLEHMGSPAGTVLEKEAVNGRAAWTRETATSILRRVQTPGAIAAFTLNLRDPDQSVRIAAALGLAQHGMSLGSDVLESVARDKNSDYWTEAIVALAGLGQSSALREVTRVLEGPDEALKGRIVWAIARSGNRSLKALTYRMDLEAKPEFQSMLSEKLLQPSDPRDLATLRKEASDNCAEIAGMIALRKLIDAGKPTSSVQSISCGLSSTREEVRQLAVQVALQTPNLFSTLADNLNSPALEVQIGALEAIQKVGQRQQFRDVEKFLTSSVRSVSLTAAKALAALDPQQAQIVFATSLHSDMDYVRLYSAAMLLKLMRDG